MPNSSTHVRHGLYLPVELLDRIRTLAQEEKSSINKQIERIIKEWLENRNHSEGVSRQALLSFPLPRRREILESQARSLVTYYQDSSEFSGGETDLFDYE